VPTDELEEGQLQTAIRNPLRIAGAPAESLAEATAAFLSYSAAKNLSPRTLEYYRERLTGFAVFLGAGYPGLPPGEVTSAVVREFVTWTRERTSPATANHGLAVLRRMFAFLVAEGFLQKNPCATVSKLAEERRLLETFTKEQVRAILATCGRDFYGMRDRAILLTLLDTGLRASELCSLSLSDVDWTNQTFRVFGKGSRERSVPFGQAVRSALSSYLAKRGDADGPLFVNHYAEPLNRYRLRELVRRRSESAGIQGVRCSPHTFRHTCAVSFLRAGGDTFTLQRLLGHTSQAMTARYCESLSAEDVREQHRLHSPADALAPKAKTGRRRLR